MNPAKASNAANSDTTSKSGHSTSPDAPPSGKPSSTLSEAEFLQQQAAAAKKAISGAFADLSRDLAAGANPRVWMKSHPWLTLASATAAGFAAAAAVVPSKEQQALRRLEAIERAMHAGREPQRPTNGDGHAKEKKEGRGLLGMLLHELFAALSPAVMAMVNANFSPPPAAGAEEMDDAASAAGPGPMEPPSAG